MRFVALVALVALTATPATGAAQRSTPLLDRPARLEVVDVSVAAALRSLERTSGVPMAFSPDLLPADGRVSCACVFLSVGQALARILEGTGLTFTATERQVLIGRKPPTQAAARPDVALGADGRPLPDVDAIPLAELVIEPGRFGVLEARAPEMASTVTRDDIEAIPQFGDDVFRTLKRMPGVASGDVSTRLNVRGGSDRNLLVLLDGAELVEPYHLQDLEGALGIIDVQSLGSVDLITGGFGPHYGDRLAGVFEMTTRPPPPSGTRTTLGLSLSSASANSQGAFDGDRGQWLATVRRGWLDVVLALTEVEDDLSPRYWDALGRVQYLVSDRHLVSVSLLGAGDDVVWADDEAGARVESRWTNRYGWARWRAAWTDRVASTTLLAMGSLTRDRSGSGGDPDDGVFTPLDLTVADARDYGWIQFRQDGRVELGDDVSLTAGIDLRWETASYDYHSRVDRLGVGPDDRLRVETDSLDAVAEPENTETAAWLAARVRPAAPLLFEVGARFDRQSLLGDAGWSPRVLGRWDLAAGTRLRASWGLYTQSQGIHELRVEGAETDFHPRERAWQVALGVQHDFGHGITARLEAYRRAVDDPIPWFVGLTRNVDPVPEVGVDYTRVAPTEGIARGIEAFVDLDAGPRFDVSLAYALSEAKDLVDDRWIPRTLDQRHVFNAFGSWRPDPRWQVSASWQLRSGWPFTSQTLEVALVQPPDGGPAEVTYLDRDFGPVHGERLPAYRRLDLRVTRAFVSGDRRVEVFLDVFNVLGRTNLRGYDYVLQEASDGHLVAVPSDGEELLPRMPTVGLRWTF